jgi:catechol 2,3-dioxygenase-like lactoylglutathione lyase family enzyme
MKLNSISGVSCYVQDLSRTAEFYEAIGFRPGKQEPDRLTFYVNWFFVTFVAQDREDDPEATREAELPNKGAGVYIYVKVDDLDDYHDAVVAKGPEARERASSGPRRESGVRSPGPRRLQARVLREEIARPSPVNHAGDQHRSSRHRTSRPTNKN